MENEEIFKKAIEKAVKNGWEDEVLEYDPEKDNIIKAIWKTQLNI